MVQIIVEIDEALFERTQEVSQQHGEPVNRMIVDAIKRYVAPDPAAPVFEQYGPKRTGKAGSLRARVI